MMVDSILSQQWLWGVVVGATLTFISQLLFHSIQMRGERRIATMQVATLLRGWLDECESAILDHENWENSDGNIGKGLFEIPDLRIEKSLDQIVRLKSAEAKAIFDLILEKRDTNRFAASFGDIVGYEEVPDHLHKKSGALFIDGLEIYEQLVKQLGWKERPYSEEVIKKMTELANRSRTSSAT